MRVAADSDPGAAPPGPGMGLAQSLINHSDRDISERGIVTTKAAQELLHPATKREDRCFRKTTFLTHVGNKIRAVVGMWLGWGGAFQSSGEAKPIGRATGQPPAGCRVVPAAAGGVFGGPAFRSSHDSGQRDLPLLPELEVTDNRYLCSRDHP